MVLKFSEQDCKISLCYEDLVDVLDVFTLFYPIASRFKYKIIKVLIFTERSGKVWTKNITKYLQEPLIFLFENLKTKKYKYFIEDTKAVFDTFTLSNKVTVEIYLIDSIDIKEVFYIQPLDKEILVKALFLDWKKHNNIQE